MTRTRIAIFGASGRMGGALARAAREREDVAVVAALVRRDSARLGTFMPGAELRYAASLDGDVDAIVDFAGARGFDDAISLALASRLAFVSGSTGLDDAQLAALTRASASIPVLWSANFSLGIAVLKRLVADAATLLGPEFDAEIFEAHHRQKVDAPSGTAIALGQEIAKARAQRFESVARLGRSGHTGPRAEGELGFAVQRCGDVIGEHTATFAGRGERIELTHRATHRSVFAHGALRAAAWLAQRRSGRYELADLLG
ncbi:MAG TPA: 4-hydroxy-tetrahydrodipicolinate reductase [Candidatus Saccharimonadia bacterium]|nr:4-hydroxy-tetrahydrodipicolinate reductase [Candidatus Saccharimonadia bacterium]